jgi:hypothetical protein
MAGVVTTDGAGDATGTGRSMTRVVQAASAADATITARVAFISSSLSGWTSLGQVRSSSVRGGSGR